jgi:hypothetical protein
VNEHLRTWTNNFGPVSMRLDLWDTGRTRDGKSELHYALWMSDRHGSAIFEGDEYWPSPLTAIDSDESAAGLLAFLSDDGESLAYARHDDDTEAAARYTTKQRRLLAENHEYLALWERELEGEEG